ncbi:MAG TPA: bifunctional folylpolyglutamate synthase/dihydrofolate synthase [Chlorobaculum parvum]|uniref:Dihydrofolate synthase/folylpolyglutamate synthase n=1 Tax=Chlorobaculum parvum TaxID=274539 RepID=A0A7C5HDG0_9CHLB|nr:bifunctional folylpolyglutamate synthase/dihydrofolate synthase [Chlorobaculum parvum]
MDYRQSLDFLFPLHRFGIKPGLERIEALLDVLGHPERRLGTVVHLAGTNGKGTVASCMASIFTASGRKTGLFTSPHLIDFTERIRINGKPISQERVAEYCTKLESVVVELGATFFEVTTAMAFAYFADEGVDAAVIETGMGGRLDATNVVKSDIVIIPSIGLEHTEWLGESLAEIAGEKAAIIKPGSRVFTAVAAEEALEPIRLAASRQNTELHQASEARCETVAVRPGRLDLEITLAGEMAHRITAQLTGSFHASNVALALMAARSEGIGWPQIEVGLADLRRTGYRARLERLPGLPSVMLDVSHNPGGMARTVEALLEVRGSFRSLRVLLGVASDKDAAGIVRQLVAIADEVVAVPLPFARSVAAAELAEVCRQAGVARVESCDTAGEGLNFLFSNAGVDDLIFVTGSFYLAGEVAGMKRFWLGSNETGSI